MSSIQKTYYSLHSFYKFTSVFSEVKEVVARKKQRKLEVLKNREGWYLRWHRMWEICFVLKPYENIAFGKRREEEEQEVTSKK